MKGTMFYRMGNWLYRFRWPIVAFWLCALLACFPLLPDIDEPFKTTGFVDERANSTKAQDWIIEKTGFNKYNKFVLVYTSKTLKATDNLFKRKIRYSLKNLKDFPISHQIYLPDDKNKQISKNKHSAYVVIMLKQKEPISDDLLQQFRESIKTPKNMSLLIGGEAIFVDDVNRQTQKDLFKADFIATPVAIITLLLVFGSVVAAILPVVLGGICALIILTILSLLGHLFTLSVFTLNIALLLGLCLSLDYSLFVISRFRNEMDKSSDFQQAIAITQATAGKAVFFSGLAVFASLSALLLFPVNILFSIGVGGLVAVLVAMLMAVTLLPALLSVLQHRINSFSLRKIKKNSNSHSVFWRWLAQIVVRRAFFFFFFTLIFLLTLGYPFFFAKPGVSDFHILPPQSEDRRFFDTYSKHFKEEELTPIQLLVQTQSANILSQKNISELYRLTDKIKDNGHVAEVNSIVTTSPRLSAKNYYLMYQDEKKLDPNLKHYLASSTGKQFTVITVVSKQSAHSAATNALISFLGQMQLKHGLQMQLTGAAVTNHDVLQTVWRILPWALLWIMVFSYLILLILLRSLFLPLKAILMNILSLSACYGALVLVFQDGYLHQLLNFEPQGMLDISLVVIIFCALFGFSMDYEVFLLTRIKEAWEVTKDNDESIIFGIEHSSRIITSAALIVIVICCSFLVADVVMVKAFGLGIAVAIFVDAFIVRTLLVPSTMALVKSWNWYLPKWLGKILP